MSIKLTKLPEHSTNYWVKCVRPDTGETWYFHGGYSAESARASAADCAKLWPDICFTPVRKDGTRNISTP